MPMKNNAEPLAIPTIHPLADHTIDPLTGQCRSKLCYILAVKWTAEEGVRGWASIVSRRG